MRNKVTKRLRKQAEEETVGEDRKVTRRRYKALKLRHKRNWSVIR